MKTKAELMARPEIQALMKTHKGMVYAGKQVRCRIEIVVDELVELTEMYEKVFERLVKADDEHAFWSYIENILNDKEIAYQKELGIYVRDDKERRCENGEARYQHEGRRKTKHRKEMYGIDDKNMLDKAV